MPTQPAGHLILQPIDGSAQRRWLPQASPRISRRSCLATAEASFQLSSIQYLQPNGAAIEDKNIGSTSRVVSPSHLCVSSRK